MKLIEIVIDFVYRIVFGIICIYFLNYFFRVLGLSVFIGFNIWTLAVIGLLGVPGIVLLFLIRFIGSL